MAPMMDPMAMPEDMADAMDSDADADSSGPFSGSGCAPEPVPSQYEAFENASPFSIFANLFADTQASCTSFCYRCDCYTFAMVVCFVTQCAELLFNTKADVVCE